jgi:hypothetical protein
MRLKDYGYINEIKKYYFIFKNIIFYFKNYFPFVSFFNTNFIIKIFKIEFRINCYSVKPI